MTESGIATVRNTPICEVPAQALRIAATFSAVNTPNFDGVLIKPGVNEGEVMLLAAQGSKAVQILCEGNCQRSVGLPTGALRAAMRRDPEAEHVAVVKTDSGVSLRTYSGSTTVAVSMPETTITFTMPTPEPGASEVSYARNLLTTTLRDLTPLVSVQLEPFKNCLQLTGQGDSFSLYALIAGYAESSTLE